MRGRPESPSRCPDSVLGRNGFASEPCRLESSDAGDSGPHDPSAAHNGTDETADPARDNESAVGRTEPLRDTRSTTTVFG